MLKNITVFIDDSDQGEVLGLLATKIAVIHKAYLVGISMILRADYELSKIAYIKGDAAIQETNHNIAEQKQLIRLATSLEFQSLCKRYDVKCELRIIESDVINNDIYFHSLHTDLVILSHPPLSTFPENGSAEKIVLQAGVPVLLIPNTWRQHIGQHVMIAWNGSPQARRAITAALPFITKANLVTILTINGEENSVDEELPGVGIANLLSKHGAKINIINETTDANGYDIATLISTVAQMHKVDLVIIGAYSHSRKLQVLFGGVTKHLLNNPPAPLFIA